MWRQYAVALIQTNFRLMFIIESPSTQCEIPFAETSGVRHRKVSQHTHNLAYVFLFLVKLHCYWRPWASLKISFLDNKNHLYDILVFEI